MVQDPRSGDVRSHNPFPQTFKDLPIKALIYCLVLRYEFSVNNPTTIKKDNVNLILDLLVRVLVEVMMVYVTLQFAFLFQDRTQISIFRRLLSLYAQK